MAIPSLGNEPNVHLKSFIGSTSFIGIGIPVSRFNSSPDKIFFSASFAFFRAYSSVIVTNAFNVLFKDSIFSKVSSITSTGETSFEIYKLCISLIDLYPKLFLLIIFFSICCILFFYNITKKSI